MQFWKILLSICLIACFCTSLMAQKEEQEKVKEMIDEFESDLGTPIKLRYLVTEDKSGLEWLSENLEDTANYPLVVLQRSNFTRSLELIRKLQIESVNSLQLMEEYAYLDSLNDLQDAAYMEILDVERQRTEMYKRTNQELNEHIERLGQRIDLATDLGEKHLKGMNFRNLTRGLLGGAIGLSVGLVVGVLIKEGGE